MDDELQMRKTAGFCWRVTGLIVLILAVIVIAVLAWLFRDLPNPGDLYAYASLPSSKVYDRHGRLLFEMPPPYTGSHSPVPSSEIPEALRLATIATEDATFFSNPGMDGRAILRAVWINLQGGEVLAGGSTITQQLARNVLLGEQERSVRSLRRKLRELVLAVRLTRQYTKDEILTLYLNETYYGNMAYGVEAAAQAYFGKHVRDLDLAECALLAGLPQAPALYNPLEDFDAAKARQEIVLKLMVKQAYISPDASRLAIEERLTFAAAPFPIRAPHFVMAVRGYLERELGLERLEAGGLRIITTLDVDLNETARDLMRHHLKLLATCHHEVDCPPGGHNVRNAALVMLDPQTGEVLAMVGSPDYFSARIDGAVNAVLAQRQPGSSIKPITYAAAFSPDNTPAGLPLTPATMMLDVRTAFITREGAPYVPLNYDMVFRGPVRLREALASSYNLIAVKVLDTIGIETMTNLARQLGITTLDDPNKLGLAVALGGGELSLFELTAAYAAFANGGRRLYPTMLKRVEDAEGHTIWSPGDALGAQVLDARVAYLITDILSDDLARVPTFGEGSVLNLAERPVAVKTGTTTDFRDNWTIGYTPDLVVGVWVGNADNEAMHQVTGITGAAPIWHDVMASALKGNPVRDFPRPGGLVDVEVCALSGLLVGPDCPHRITEHFILGTEPLVSCDMHQRIGNRVYTVFPSEAQAWAREHGIPQPPASDDVSVEPDIGLILTQPDQGAVYHIDPAAPKVTQKIAVSAESSFRLEEVVLLADGIVLERFLHPPYIVYWSLSPGIHTFSAVGCDASDLCTRSNIVRITVE